MVCTLSFVSCRKLIDLIHPHPDDEIPTCQVSKIVTTNPGYPDGVLDIHYDQWGNPDQASQQAFGDSFLIYFRYNAQHQLTDMILADTQNRYGLWHRYAYEGQRIVRDTIYSADAYCHCQLDTISNPRYIGAYQGLYVYDVIYDNQDRVIADSVRYLVYPVEYKDYELAFTHNYAYDPSGNLIVSMFDPQPYDDKVSIFRTNKVWMFINRNYSVNNSRPAAGYNEAGLPVKFTGVNGDGSQKAEFLNVPLFNATIDYDCND